jgi:MinD superfamily P-loop ATPase
VLLVAEPTVSGKHDLERVAALADHFRLPVLVLVNKADLHWEAAREIEQFSADRGYPFLGHLPFDPDFTRAQVEGKTIMEYNNKRLQTLLTEIWEHLRSAIDNLRRKSH